MIYEYLSVSVIWNIFVVHELLTVHYTSTILHDNHVLRCICCTNIIISNIVTLHAVCYVKFSEAKSPTFHDSHLCTYIDHYSHCTSQFHITYTC
jgi:hypothetical protein